MNALRRKLARDLWHLRGQFIAVALVVMCGIATFVTMQTTYRSLIASKDEYYSAYRFADVFAQVTRAPRSVARRIAALPGITAVEDRVVRDVTLDVPGLAEPATGRLISIPEVGQPLLNRIHLRSGRWIDPSRPDEVIASESFCEANSLRTGDSIDAIINGRLRRLHIVGVGLSPEYVYEIRGGEVFPDRRRFGVFWIGRREIASAFNSEGAFNDLAIAVAPGTNVADVIASVDDITRPYGGGASYARDEQTSSRYVSDEIKQDRVSGYVVPAIFIAVSAFLIHLVLARLVQTQREQIALLKAFGYRNRDVAVHYLGFASVAVLAGALVAIPLGVWLASSLTAVYKEFFRFPVYVFEVDLRVVLVAFAISGAAAVAGTLSAVGAAVRLPPAEAMRPEAPPAYKAGIIERLGLLRFVTPATRIVVRNIARRRLKSALSIAGIAMAVAILLVGRFMFDAIDYIMEVEFEQVLRDDVTLPFSEVRNGSVIYDVKHLPGVMQVEASRAVAVRLRHGAASERTAILGVDSGAELRRIIDRYGNKVSLPPAGLVLSLQLARMLQVKPGDAVIAEVLEGTRPTRRLEVVNTADDLVGTFGYMERSALNRLMDESDVVSAVFLTVDPREASTLYAKLKKMPAVAGVTVREAMHQSFRDTIGENLAISNLTLVVFACVIAAGVIYNSARIALSERGRELASLRVLGFTKGEVGAMLAGEQAIFTAVAIPLGMWIGYLLAGILVRSLASDLYRIPLVVSTKSYVFACIVIVIAAIGSSAIVIRRVRTLDLVEVLKTRE